MSATAEQTFPTMIIPRGTEIRVNNHGQLSIKTPGNLVIQNSGNYSEIESTNGSIRIDENVTVEAVSIRAGQACFIQGTLTAWRVHAKRITLEDRARAFIMLQESEQLDLSKGSRLVGNFASEKELYLMMGKFTSQLRELVIRQFKQLLHVVANARVTRLQLLVQCRQSELKSEIRLNHAVVNVVSDARPFLFGGVRSEVVDEPDVFHHRRYVVHQLQHEIHIGAVEPDWTIDDVQPSDRLVTIVNGYR